MIKLQFLHCILCDSLNLTVLLFNRYIWKKFELSIGRGEHLSIKCFRSSALNKVWLNSLDDLYNTHYVFPHLYRSRFRTGISDAWLKIVHIKVILIARQETQLMRFLVKLMSIERGISFLSKIKKTTLEMSLVIDLKKIGVQLRCD